MINDWLSGKLKPEKIVGVTDEYSADDDWHFLVKFRDANGNAKAAMVPRSLVNRQIPQVRWT